MRVLIEERVQIAEEMARAYAEARVIAEREATEARVQTGEEVAMAYAAARVVSERETTEARVQDAALEAKMYARQGLRTQGAGLRAIGKVVAELVKDNKRLSRACDALSTRLEACEETIRELRQNSARAEKEAATPPQIEA